jgi:molybdate transport system ATP-binding protein
VFVPPEERRVGVVFQDGLLFPHLTVAANVAYAARAQAGSSRTAAHTAADWLERLGAGSLAGSRPHELSGGQAQRVGLARALAARPRLLLLDEPLSSLDVGARARVRRLLAEHLATFEGPRILITHDPAEAAALADEVMILEDGAVTQTGPPATILRAPRTAYAADLAGLNLIEGTAAGGEVTTAGPVIRVADTNADGAVLLTIPPRAVSLYPGRPEGSPRNTWEATVSSIEKLNGLCRVSFGNPLPLTAEITVEAREALGLGPGSRVWVAIKATEVGVLPG